jgi:hypothetical protein
MDEDYLTPGSQQKEARSTYASCRDGRAPLPRLRSMELCLCKSGKHEGHNLSCPYDKRVLVDEGQTVGNELGEDVGVQHHNNAHDRG